MPIGPRDIEEAIGPTERTVIASMQGKIDGELLRRRYRGPDPFKLDLAKNLPESTRNEIMRPYIRLWQAVYMREEGGMWYIYIQAFEAKGE
jgi:hypothetical protein